MHECHEEVRVPRLLNPTQTQKAQELLWGSSAQWACCGVKPAAGPTLPRGGPADTVPGVGVGAAREDAQSTGGQDKSELQNPRGKFWGSCASCRIWDSINLP